MSAKLWSKEVPSEEGWYWIKYKGKRGKVKCPCAVVHFGGGKFVIHTARNDIFASHSPKEWSDARFGPTIEVPEG